MLWERGAALGTLQLRSGVADACLVIITLVVAPIWDCEAQVVAPIWDCDAGCSLQTCGPGVQKPRLPCEHGALKPMSLQFPMRGAGILFCDG